MQLKHKYFIALFLALCWQVVFAAPPTVVNFTPATGAMNQSNAPTLIIEFNDVVIPKIGNILIRRYGSESIVETIPAISAKVTGANTKFITITPDTLLIGTQYYVEIQPNAFSTVTNEFYAGTATKDTWTFTTYSSIGDLRMWFDASEQGSVILDGLNRIMQWRDLSGNNFHLNQTNPGLRPAFNTSTQSGKPQIRFTNHYLELLASAVPIVNDSSKVTIFIVHNPLSVSYNTVLATEHFDARMNRFDSFTPTQYLYNTFNLGQQTSVYQFDGSTTTIYSDNIVNAQDTNTNIIGGIKNIRVGSTGISGGGSWNYSGNIQEIRVYGKVFTNAQRAAIVSELYDKWKGVPKEHSSLLMWFDASDLKTYSFTPMSKVGYWVNRADNKVDAYKETSISSPLMIDNGQNELNTFNFSKDDSLRIDYALPEAGKTVFFVMKSKVLSSSFQRAFFTPATSAHHSVRINNNDFIYGDAITHPEDDVWRMHTTVYSGTNVAVYSNAVFIDDQSYTPQGTGPYLTIGDDGQGIRAEVAEIIVYNRVLPQAEIAQIEGYLTRKWDLPALFAESFYVEDNDENALQDQTFEILFSGNIRLTGTGAIRLKRRDNNALFATFTSTSPQISRSGRTLYIDASGMAVDTEYYFEIDPGFVESTLGMPYEGFVDNKTWNFKTLPFDLSGLVLWLDADDDATFSLTTSDKVVSWFDKSEDKRQVTQSNDVYRPTRINYSRNPSRRILRADNADLDLINGPLDTYDIFQVFRTNVSNDFVGNYAIVGAKVASSRTYLTMTGTNQFHALATPGEIYQDGKLVTNRTLLDIDDFTAVYTQALNPGALREVFINCAEGTRGYSDLAEILVFDRKKSAADRDGIFEYLMTKWSLTGPKVISSTPNDNEANAQVTAANNTSLVFDRDVFKGSSGTIQIRKSSDASIVATLPVASPGITTSGPTVNINFGITLANDTDYYIYIADDTFVDATGFPVRKYDEKPDFFNFHTVKAAPAPFSIKEINGLQLWYDIADYGTLTFAAANVVQRIDDKSGNQRDGYQGDNISRAVINQMHQNGHDVLTNLSKFYYEENSMYKAVDIFQVFRSPNNLFDYYGSYSGARLAQHRDYLFNYRNSNFHTLPQDSWYKDSVLMSINQINFLDEFMLLETITTNSYKRDYQFARQEGFVFTSHIGEYIVFDRKLTASERDQVTGYLITKWKISPLKLLNSSPQDNAVNVSINTTIDFTFNLPVFPGAGNVIIRDQATGTIVQSFDMSSTLITNPNPQTIRFNLLVPLAADTRYYIEIEEGAFVTVKGYKFGGFNDSASLNFKTDSGIPGSFAPDEVNGLELWLDAQDAATITTLGSVVTQWNDKSFNNRHAVMADNTYRPTHSQYTDKFGNPYLTFTGKYMDLQNNGFVGKNIFYVFRSDSHVFSTYGAVLGGVVNAERAYLYSSGNSIMHSDPYPEEMFNDGDSQLITGSLGYIKRPQVHMIQPYLSNSVRNYRVGASEGYRANMQIGEILVYNRDLTTSERNDVTRYLMGKWNVSGPKITSLTPRDNDVVSSIDKLTIIFDENIFRKTGNIYIKDVNTGLAVRTIDINSVSEVSITAATLEVDLGTPINAPGRYYIQVEGGAIVDIDDMPFFELEDSTRYNLTITSDPFIYNGLQLWLDSSDGASITTVSGNKISNWLDRSGNTRNASQIDVNRMPTIGLITQNGLNTTSFVDDTLVLEDQDFQAVEIIQIFRVNTPASFSNQTTILSNYQDIEREHKFQSASSRVANPPIVDYIQRNLENLTSTRELYPIKDFFINSIVTNNYNPTYDHNIASYNTQYFKGDMAEIMVFDRRLSDADRNQLIKDLSIKWDIDIYAPVIISTTPADDSITGDLYQNFTITFDELVYPIVGNIKIIREEDGYVLETIEVNSPKISGWGTNVITIDPLARLFVGSHFYVTIDKGTITDEHYNRMEAVGIDHEDWDFNTERDPKDIFFRWKAF
jgi:hypothetical protein